MFERFPDGGFPESGVLLETLIDTVGGHQAQAVEKEASFPGFRAAHAGGGKLRFAWVHVVVCIKLCKLVIR
jgi:hypothetical protein